MIGTVIAGRYEIVRLIGEGGMGSVYEATHRAIGKKVALKLLHKDFVKDEEVLQRFHREAKIAGELNHANIVPVIDYGVSGDGLPFIVMELLEGQSLAELIRESAPLDVSRSVHILRQVLSALDEAHGHGIIHRDIKPANLFLANVKGRGEEVKILDFGISKLVSETPMPKLTKSGTMIGTCQYMAPEQIRAARIDHRTDLYACGVVLYEMVTGEVPFPGNNTAEIVYKISFEAPPDPRLLMPDGPESLHRAISKAIERDPARRFQSVKEFREAIDEIKRVIGKGERASGAVPTWRETPKERPASPPPPRQETPETAPPPDTSVAHDAPTTMAGVGRSRRSAWLVLVVIALVAAALVGGYALFAGKGRGPAGPATAGRTIEPTVGPAAGAAADAASTSSADAQGDVPGEAAAAGGADAGAGTVDVLLPVQQDEAASKKDGAPRKDAKAGGAAAKAKKTGTKKEDEIGKIQIKKSPKEKGFKLEYP